MNSLEIMNDITAYTPIPLKMLLCLMLYFVTKLKGWNGFSISNVESSPNISNVESSRLALSEYKTFHLIVVENSRSAINRWTMLTHWKT